MNKIWLDESRDLKMNPYKVTSVDDQTGIIEFVPGETLERI
jgi:phosphatidylinositol kinase/protein kinase (PI-3  family)